MKINSVLKSICSALMVAAVTMPLPAQVNFNLDAGKRGTKIGNLHYGIFFEEINHAGDGGLYAELIRNRSFEDASTPQSWSKTGSATWKIVSDELLNDAQQKALEVNFKAAGDAIINGGFWGINSSAGKKYNFSLWLKADNGYNGKLHISLIDKDGN